MAASRKTAMIDEICEQPALLVQLLARRTELTAPFVRLMRERRIKRLLFVGNGSPYYAGCTLVDAARELLGVDASAVPAGYFARHGSFFVPELFSPEEVLLVCPAETGHSKGQVDAARRARSLGVPVMCTTLIPDGVLARECDVVLPKVGDHEVAMAATKGQTQALLLLTMCFADASRALGLADPGLLDRIDSALDALSDNVGRSIDLACSWFGANRDRVMAARQFFLLGYGCNFGTVQEAALKFFECHRRPTVALELEESLHGPFRALHRDDMCLFLRDGTGPEAARCETLAAALGAYCDNDVLLAREGTAPGPDVLPVATSDVAPVSAIEYLVPLQVLAYLVSDALGIDLSVPLVDALDPVMLPAYED